jgi:hypothetical protein
MIPLQHASAQGTDTLGPLLRSEANRFELGMIRLDSWLNRIQASVSASALPSSSIFFYPAAFDFSFGRLRIGVLASDLTQQSITNDDCAKSVNALRQALKGSGIEVTGIKSMVGYAFLPTVPADAQKLFVPAASIIEQSTIIQVNLKSPDKSVSCEGNLFQEQVIFFQ